MKIASLSDEAFFSWLAGLIDGEGSFLIRHDKRQGSYDCQFTLKLRDDDEPLLRAVQERLGLGRIHPDTVRSGNSHPTIRWHVCSKHECAALIEILDSHPLLTRKARDFAIWREAVAEWTTRERRNGTRWGAATRGSWERMESFFEEIRSVREYAPITE